MSLQLCDQAEDTLTLLDREELLALVAQLRGSLQVQQQTLEEIIDERNAARLLNELCHFI